MTDSAGIVVLSFLMFIGSLAAGLVPLVCSFSESNLDLVSTFGAGLLVGAALAVIIPEGVNMLFSEKIRELKIATLPPGVTVVGQDVEQRNPNLHVYIGASLVFGFIFMMLVDQLSSQRKADGIALGAAATTAQKDVEAIVFLAIMLHKAPAAFGLVTFLMHENLVRNTIRRHLFVFSSAAPMAALITFYGLSQEGKATLSSVNGTAIAMLFSAGTFLYVAAVHVLPEIAYGGGSHSSSRDSSRREKNGFTKTELVCLVVGSVLPLFLTMFHGH
ncbi:zinc transporter ZIP9-like isoform X3 [Artemia franciscana]|uniref:zinc transporter ZIP9-like isoform X3 n=1 Tax=Artemia franciscana TaxID=6661 RepID=UPI0032DB25FD